MATGKPTVASNAEALGIAGNRLKHLETEFEQWGEKIDLLAERLEQASGAPLVGGDVLSAIRAVQADLLAEGGIGKDVAAPAKAGGFAYRGIDQVMAAVSPLLVKHGLVIAPHNPQGGFEMVQAGGRSEALIELVMTYRVYGPGGIADYIDVSIYAHGMNARDKAATTANSYAWRTLVTQLFAIPVETDDGESRSEEIDADPKLNSAQLNALGEALMRLPEHVRDQAIENMSKTYGASDQMRASQFQPALNDLHELMDKAENPAETVDEAAAKLADAGLTEDSAEATAPPKDRIAIGIQQLQETFMTIPADNQAACTAALTKAELVPITELKSEAQQKAAVGIMEEHGAHVGEPF